jgi:hypothetical protein
VENAFGGRDNTRIGVGNGSGGRDIGPGAVRNAFGGCEDGLAAVGKGFGGLNIGAGALRNAFGGPPNEQPRGFQGFYIGCVMFALSRPPPKRGRGKGRGDY